MRVVVAGGVATGGTPLLTGPITDATLRELHVDLVFVGADGVSTDAGLTAEDQAVAYAARAFIASAQRAIAVVDAPAVGRTAFTWIGDLDAIEELITAEDVDAEAAAALEAAGMHVTTA